MEKNKHPYTFKSPALLFTCNFQIHLTNAFHFELLSICCPIRRSTRLAVASLICCVKQTNKLLIWTIFPIRFDIIYIPNRIYFLRPIFMYAVCICVCVQLVAVYTEMMASPCLAVRHWQISFHFTLEFRFRRKTIFADFRQFVVFVVYIFMWFSTSQFWIYSTNFCFQPLDFLRDFMRISRKNGIMLWIRIEVSPRTKQLIQ